MRPRSNLNPAMVALTMSTFIVTASFMVVVSLSQPAHSSTVQEHVKQTRVVVATLHGKNVVPGPGDANGKGHAVVALRSTKGKVCGLKLAWQGLGKVTGAHIDRAVGGEKGHVVVDLTRWVTQGPPCVKARSGLIQRMANHPWRYHVTMDTKAFPAGAIRGQEHHQG
jgi:anthranilate/para-aminobenzoate synthase component II